MTPEEQRLAFAINSSSPVGPSITPDEFLSRTGVDDPQAWALAELMAAIRTQDTDDAEAALLIAAVFGMDSRWSAALASLLVAEWHELHEDIAFDLGQIGESDAVPALVQVVHWHPSHLDYDNGRALALTAIHSLGNINGIEAETALTRLLDDPNPEFGATVQRVLSRRTPTT